MRYLSLIALATLCMSFTNWGTNLDVAKKEAVAQHKLVLLNFSGSDWCGPCIKLHKQIFSNEIFTNFSDKELILVNADFPRLKKNQLSKELIHENELLAEKYNPKGAFPLTLLLNTNGEVIKTWDGFPKENIDAFVHEIDAALHAHH